MKFRSVSKKENFPAKNVLKGIIITENSNTENLYTKKQKRESKKEYDPLNDNPNFIFDFKKLNNSN